MKLPKGLRRRKGVALVLALLTTTILVTLSLAFVSLSLSEARTSRSYGYEETSIQAASYGLEYALTYMGRGTQTGPNEYKTWEWQKWPNPSGNPSTDFGFYNVLRVQTRPVKVIQEIPSAAETIDVTVLDIVADPSLEAFVPANLSNQDKIQLRKDLRRIRLVNHDLAPRVVMLNNELGFTCDIVVEPILMSRGQGRHDYRLTSTARIYNIAAGGATNAYAPVATRVVEARVKESSFDYSHFIANGRTWNVNGYTPGTSPNNASGTDLADYVVIPKDYVEQGPMRVDGQNKNQAPPGSVLRHVYEQAGNLKFMPNAAQNGPKFSYKLTINQPANVYPDAVTDSTMTGFNAGFVPGSAPIGIPDFRQDDMKLAAKLVVKDTDQSGLITISNSQIPGALGSSVAAPKSSNPTNPFYDGFDTMVTSDGQTVQVPRPVDFRPRFPNVEVTLSKDVITIQTRSTLDNSVSDVRTIRQDQLQSGLLYVQGGNVVVKTDPAQKFQGKLSIVAGEDPARESFTPNDSTIYSNAARAFFDYQKNRWDTYVHEHNVLPPDPGSYPTPPYSVAQLRAAQNAGLIPPNSLEAGMPQNQILWPAPPVEKDATGNPVRYTVEREGNVVIADDIRYNDKSGNQLGLFAQNFVLLNDNTPRDPVTGKEDLTIDAVLVSKERTVSFDWDNTGRQDPTTWKQLTAPRGANEPQRTVNINGSVIGEYIDVEGDQLGRGYKNQTFKYDLSLRNANPPFMPRPDLAALTGGYRFMILHYLDRGSLSTAGILGP
ncbi:hypothetical protein JST97_37600 [bacterium]|nr:hypothetical protein [bacterium]